MSVKLIKNCIDTTRYKLDIRTDFLRLLCQGFRSIFDHDHDADINLYRTPLLNGNIRTIAPDLGSGITIITESDDILSCDEGACQRHKSGMVYLTVAGMG